MVCFNENVVAMEDSKQKIYVIINPISGMGSKDSIPRKIATHIDQHRYEVHFHITGYAGHAFEIASEAVQNGAKYVVAVGGDGTVNEVAKALVQTECVLGIIPFGSGNGLARDLHIPSQVDKAIDVLLRFKQVEIDYGVANGHTFFCTCGMGFDARVSETFAKQKIRGPIAYAKSMVETYIGLEPEMYEISFPEGTTICEKAFLVTCANATQYGNNAVIAPKADMQDGLMNVAILKPIGTLDIPKTIVQLFSRNINANHNLTEVVSNSVNIKRQKAGWIHIDGEPIFEEATVQVTLVPKGLKVIVP